MKHRGIVNVPVNPDEEKAVLLSAIKEDIIINLRGKYVPDQVTGGLWSILNQLKSETPNYNRIYQTFQQVWKLVEDDDVVKFLRTSKQPVPAVDIIQSIEEGLENYIKRCYPSEKKNSEA